MERSGRLSFADAAVAAVVRPRADRRVATCDRDFQRPSGVSVGPEQPATR